VRAKYRHRPLGSPFERDAEEVEQFFVAPAEFINLGIESFELIVSEQFPDMLVR